jgi:anti-anti-sigma factor
MQITTETDGSVLDLRLKGRLDNEAADDLLAAVDDALRNGHRAALVDLQQVDYVSSAGLGALVRAQKRFHELHGILGIASTSPQVAEILQITKLAKILVCDAAEVRAKSAGATGTLQPSFRVAATDGLGLAIYDLNPAEKLRCCVWGDPQRLVAGRADNQQVSHIRFPSDSFGLGIGAFGDNEAECANRFGEFIAAAGGVAAQPTPEGGKPDYQVASGGFVPRPHVLYGLSCSGPFAQMIRFEAESLERPTGLSTLVQQCLQQSAAKVAGIVIVAEAAGLIGATLRRSPLLASSVSGASFTHPEIRQWFSFASERVYPHSLVVVAGVATQGMPCGDVAALAPLVRPLGPKMDTHGHFHAAVFSYRPLKKRRLILQDMVLSLFESEELQAVLHLLHDDRAISGNGESQLVAGACWVGPIDKVAWEDQLQ